MTSINNLAVKNIVLGCSNACLSIAAMMNSQLSWLTGLRMGQGIERMDEAWLDLNLETAKRLAASQAAHVQLSSAHKPPDRFSWSLAKPS